jgi:hypothetical protein
MTTWRQPLKNHGRLWRLGLLVFCIASCHKAEVQPGRQTKCRIVGSVQDIYQGPSLFQDITAATNIQFTWRNTEEKDLYTLLESLGGGVALLDFDGDGLLDLFATGGGYLGGDDDHIEISGASSKLYKNLGGWKFQDVTRATGLEEPLHFSHGCAVADYDCDGWPDLLVTGWRRIALYHNEPVDVKAPAKGRKFVEVSKQAGFEEGGWSTSAAWADLDGDGYPDVYICHYLNWSPANHPKCQGTASSVPREICGPRSFRPLAHVVYRNNRNGTFSNVSEEAGLIGYDSDEKDGDKDDRGRGLAVLLADLNNDGRADIYVANDTGGNLLYVNRGDWKFEEKGLSMGVARNDVGTTQGSMGGDAADYDRSGWQSLFVTNFETELHALYRNLGPKGQFLFSTAPTGLASIGSNWVGWGTRFVDLDNDGWEDLVIVHGHVFRRPVISPLAQRPILFRNLGNGRFEEITERGGPFFHAAHRGRGLSVGDLDNDGRADLVVTRVNEPIAVLRNIAGENGKRSHWLGLDLRGKDRRNLVGTRVTAEIGKQRIVRWIKGGGSYLCDHDPRIIIGLGTSNHIDRLTINWTHGGMQSWEGNELSVDRYLQIREGEKAFASVGPGAK